MNRIKNYRKRSIGILVVLLFVLSFSITPALLFSNYNFGSGFEKSTDEEQNLNLSTNYLFKGTTYTFNLDNFYDDEDLTKIWTGAKFQTEAFNGTSLEWSGVVNNDTVTPVDNDETQYGDPSNINMINGTTDSADNMKVNDASYTTFTSTHTDGYIYETPSQWDDFTFTNGTGDTIGELETIDANYSTLISTECISNEFIDSITYTWAVDAGGTLENTQTDDGNSKNITSRYDVGEGKQRIVIILNFDPVVGGRDFYISAHIESLDTPGQIYINDILWKNGNDIDFDDDFHAGVNSIKYYTTWFVDWHGAEIYYFKIIEGESPVPALLDVQVDIQVDNPDCSSIEYFKYSHKTNVSVTIDLDIWNWDSSTWYEIESIDNSASFDDDSFTLGLGSDYINNSFGVRIRFQATSSSNNFELQIDRFRLDYLTPPAELEMTITFPFSNYNEDLLAMNVQSWQRTNKTQLINFSIWNFDTGAYVQISSSSDTTFTKKEYNTTSPANFISSSGVVKLNWTGLNITNDFELHIDYLLIQIFYKLDLEHSKSFDTNGIYRYRWCVLGSIHYTQWVTFEIVDPVPNFHAISESDVTTRWILQGADISPVENFTDDISGSNWYLYGSEEYMSITRVPTDDAVIISWLGDANFGDIINLDVDWIWNDLIEEWIETWTYIKYEVPYLTDNCSDNSYFRAYFHNVISSPDVKVYNTTDFDEMTITWNNKPASTGYITTTNLPGTGWRIINLNNVYDYYFLNVSAQNDQGVFYSSEHTNQPTITHNISKNYQGSGYMYMQTNTTETIALKSTVYGTNYTLSSGDYFQVDFQTSSDSQINLILLKDGVINKTLTLSQSGNPNFNRHTAKISVGETVEFDQLKISSTFEDKDYIKVYDIKTYKYTITGDSADFYVGSRRTEDVYLTPDTYNLRIFEEGDEKIDTNITIGSSDYYYVYTPTANLQCRLTLFSTEGDFLNFEDYHITVNRSLNGEYYEFSLLDNIFYADVEPYIYIDVYDRFNALINSFERLASDYIDLEIEVYSLQIKNLQTQKTTVDINTTHVYPLLYGDSLYFMLAKNYYQIGFYDEYNYYKNFTIYLNSNQAYQLNSSLKSIYFSMFTYDGLGINHDLVRFYINDERKNFGFNLMLEDTLHLLILDFFNNTLANETIDANTYDNSEYNLFIEIYSLVILNQFTYEDIIVNITQVDSGVWMTQIIPKQFGLTYRFLPNVEYNITIYFTNATLYTSRIVNLTTNSHIESFGVPTTTPEYPKDVYFGVYTTTGLGINHDLLRFYIDDVRTDFGFNRIENMIITITVKDYFNTTLFDQIINTSGIYEYNILITLYSLKVKNEARVYSNYTLKRGVLETTGFIIPQEIIEYQLASNNYVFEFTNNEDGSFHTININLNVNKIIIINSTFFTAYFGLFDQYDHRLDNSLFSLYLNGTRKDFGFIELSSEYYNITVYDWLNIPVFDQIIYLFNYTEYNIYITVFELQIRHLAQENSDFSLCETISGNYINFSMSPDTITSYMLSNSTYNISWTNGENLQTSYYFITLDSNYILTLSSTYNGIYFALFTYDGVGINHNLVKFYINESRKDFGFNLLTSASAEIVVLDFFNNTLFNQTIDFSSLSEYNIFVEIYSLIILNQFTYEDIITNITQVGSGIWLTHIIPKQFALPCRFTPNMNYTINVYYVNNSLYTTRTINLTENNHIESFGTPTLPSEYPKDIYFSVYTGTGLAIQQQLVKLYLDGDRADFGFNTIGSVMVSIVVKDFFNTTLFNQNVNTSGIYEYDILITLYSLKIKNEAELTANYTLRLGGLTETGNILPEEIIEYQLSSNNYVFDYTNNEDGSFHTININLNQDRVYILNTTYYDIYFSLYDVNLHTFYSTQYEFRLNNTIQDLGLIEDLQTDAYNITIKDRFGTYLFNNIINLRGLNEYRIEISLYELQIRHLAGENSNLTLTEDVLNNTYSFIMTPDSIKSILMGSSNYTLNWTNGENNQLIMFSINLTSDTVIKLNTTYYDVHFALFNFDGLGLESYLFRFYINNERKDLGFNEMQIDTNRLTVKDYFGATLYDALIDTRQYTEYNIYVEVYALILNNNYTHSIYIEIERNDYEIRQIIPAQASIQYRFLPNIRYEIRVYDTNNNKLHEETVKLDENNKIVSFGFYSTYVPSDPLPLINAMNMLIWFAIFVIFILFIIIVLYVRFKKEKASIPIELRRFIKQKKKKSNIKKNGYSDKDIYID